MGENSGLDIGSTLMILVHLRGMDFEYLLDGHTSRDQFRSTNSYPNCSSKKKWTQFIEE